jgi:CHAD domain-containing protein
MNAKKQLAKYFIKRVDAIEGLIKQSDAQLTKDYFHQLRVEIKKIQALAEMLKSSTKGFNPKKVISPIRKIFDQAGKIRQIQLAEETLKKYDPDGALQLFPSTLHLKEHEEKINFTVLLDRVKKKISKAVNRIKPVIKKLDSRDLKKYIEDLKQEIDDLQKRPLEAKQVHELRKGLKKLYYNLKSLKLKDNSTDFKNGKVLQELMGQWHDKRVMARDLLKATEKRITAPDETGPILKIAYQLDAKSLQLYKKINLIKEEKIF